MTPDTRSNPSVRTVPEAASKAAGRFSDEEEWIGQARAGDQAAFRKLVERHSARAIGLARRMLGSDADAEEVAQDSFVRAWRALPRFRGDSSFSTWLHRIVVRRALDRSATLKVRRAVETGLEEAHEPTEAPAPGVSREHAMRLDRLLELLTGVQRAAVVLDYYEDRSVEQVARAMGIPVGTVKTHLHRARALMRAGWVEEKRGSARE